MRTELVRLGSLLLGGVNFYGDPFSAKGGWDSENEIGKTWSRFTEHLDANPERPYSRNMKIMYEVHIYGNETASKGFIEVFTGEEISTAELPVAMVSKHIPASDYLKLTLSGQEIISDWWRTLDTDILSAYPVTRNPAYIIEAYDDRFTGMDRIDDSVLDVYIPVWLASA